MKLNILVLIYISFLAFLFVDAQYFRESFEDGYDTIPFRRNREPKQTKIDALTKRVEALEKDFKESSNLVTYAVETIDTRMNKNEKKMDSLSSRVKDLEGQVSPMKKSVTKMEELLSDVEMFQNQ